MKTHPTGLYLSSLLFYSLLVSICRRTFRIQPHCFHFHLWKVIFPSETCPSSYCYNLERACCNVGSIGDRHWYRNRCHCFLIFATDPLCSLSKSGHACDSFSHNLFLKVYFLKAQWVYRAEQEELEMSSAPISISFSSGQGCLSQWHRHVHTLPLSYNTRERRADAEQSKV